MARPWTEKWFLDCEKHWGRVLTGERRHWCPDLGGVPIDETITDYCRCFRCKCGQLLDEVVPFARGPLDINREEFRCSKRLLWNFWKHSYKSFDVWGNLKWERENSLSSGAARTVIHQANKHRRPAPTDWVMVVFTFGCMFVLGLYAGYILWGIK